jgi:hypothetical protein
LGARFADKPRFVSEQIGRRAFIARAIFIGTMWRTTGFRIPSAPALRIGIIPRSDDENSLVMLGARLGAEEASHSATLFGAAGVELITGSIDEVLARNVPAVLTTEVSTDACLRLADAVGKSGAVFMNATCADDTLRGDNCRASTFHVAPSRRMLADALDEARRNGRMSLPADASASAWDASLERFGADTLNNRFRARFNKPMTADAWCAWFTVKLLGEASLRAKSVDARAIGTYLRRASAQFDGHKGRPLSFRAWDNQLRQPVYVVAPSVGAPKVVFESPGSTTPSASSREVLDKIGSTAASTTCRFAP